MLRGSGENQTPGGGAVVMEDAGTARDTPGLFPPPADFSSAIGLPMAEHFSPTPNPQSKEPGEDAILEASLLKTEWWGRDR